MSVVAGRRPEPAADGGGSSRTPGEPAAAEILASRRWVLDPAGAPSAFATANTDQTLGDDPIADARAVFAYVERAIDEAVRVVEWNPESLEYRKDEDPFETPKDGSGVTRYDFERPNLPKASQTGTGANQVTPDTRHFRKMSVYVKDKRIIRVVEKIDVESRLDDLEKIYDTKFPKDRSDAEVAAIAVEALNVIRTGQGQDPIRMRDMEFSLKDLGTDVKVDMPADTMKASLALLQNRGRPADAASGVVEAADVRARAQAASPAALRPIRPPPRPRPTSGAASRLTCASPPSRSFSWRELSCSPAAPRAKATGSSSTGAPGSPTSRASSSRSRSRRSPSTAAGRTGCGRTCRASRPTTWPRSPCCSARDSTFSSAWTGRRWPGWR